MRTLTSSAITTVLLLSVLEPVGAQITANPIPAPIAKHGLAVEIKDVVRLPETRGLLPADQDVTPAGWARVSFVRDLPDGRRFANDSRGFLYIIDGNNPPQLYANVSGGLPARGLQPARERVHRLRRSIPSSRRTDCSTRCMASARPGNPATPNFIPPGFTAAR